MITRISFCILLLFTFSISTFAQEQKINCNFTKGFARSDTISFETTGKLRDLEGVTRNPDSSFANAIFEIYKVPENTNKDIDYEKYKELTSLSNRLLVCRTNENTGRFKVENIPDGTYIVQFSSLDIASTLEIYIIKISKDKGKKKDLEIQFNTAI